MQRESVLKPTPRGLRTPFDEFLYLMGLHFVLWVVIVGTLYRWGKISEYWVNLGAALAIIVGVAAFQAVFLVLYRKHLNSFEFSERGIAYKSVYSKRWNRIRWDEITWLHSGGKRMLVVVAGTTRLAIFPEYYNESEEIWQLLANRHLPGANPLPATVARS